MTIAPFPHTYSVALDDERINAGSRQPLAFGAPPQFGGSDDVWSPEQLLLAAALACLKTTFDAYARRERIVIRGWRGTATGTLVKGRGGPVFSSIDLDVEIEADPVDETHVRATLATAEHSCIVSRALAVPVRLSGNVIAPRERAAG